MFSWKALLFWSIAFSKEVPISTGGTIFLGTGTMESPLCKTQYVYFFHDFHKQNFSYKILRFSTVAMDFVQENCEIFRTLED